MKFQQRHGVNAEKTPTPVYRFNTVRPLRKSGSPKYDFESRVHPSPDYEIQKSKVHSDVNGDTFHESIAGSLAMARMLLLFPLHGIFGSPQDLTYKVSSAISIVSALATVPVLWVALTAAAYAGKSLSMVKNDTSGGIVNKMAGCVFYLNAWISALLMRGIAKGWPKLQARWRFEELRANVIKMPPLKFKLAATTGVVMFLAIIEHWLSIVYKTKNCQAGIRLGNSTFYDCLSEYCKDSHSFVFKLISYNTFLGLLIVFTSEIATFAWNFQDLLLILISFGLCSRFQHINAVMNKLDINNTQPSDWKSIRELYCGGLELTREASKLVAPLVLLSFSNNLFFICLQMFNGLSPSSHGTLYMIYFFGSFGFMVCRVTSVALSAASIPLEAKKYITHLRCCPSTSYCSEVHRLCQQLVHEEVSLTGMGFFSVNRNFMLGVMGAVATYEIVLLQMV